MATRDVSIRISVMDGDKARQEFVLTGEEGQKALEKINDATKPANDNIKLINSTVDVWGVVAVTRPINPSPPITASPL